MTKKKSILFIDDDEIHNFVMKNYLKLINADVEASFIKSAIEALDLLGDIDYENWPDIIVLDLKMPLMEGKEFIENMNRLHPEFQQFTCLVVLTASVSPMDKATITEYRAVKDYLVKPLTTDQLKHLLDNCPKNYNVIPQLARRKPK